MELFPKVDMYLPEPIQGSIMYLLNVFSCICQCIIIHVYLTQYKIQVFGENVSSLVFQNVSSSQGDSLKYDVIHGQYEIRQV